MLTPHEGAAPQEHALPALPTYRDITAGPKSSATHVLSIQNFAAKGPHVMSHSAATATSSPLIWESKNVNAGEGHIAGLGKNNLASIENTGF